MHLGLAGNDQSFLEEIDFNHGEGNLKTVKKWNDSFSEVSFIC